MDYQQVVFPYRRSADHGCGDFGRASHDERVSVGQVEGELVRCATSAGVNLPPFIA